jgi:hypothetical protein
VFESYRRRQSWHSRTFLDPILETWSQARTLWVENFILYSTLSKIDAFLTFAHSGGHYYTNIQLQVKRYPKGEGMLYETSRKLIWHSAPPRGVLLPLTSMLSFSPITSKTLFWVTPNKPVCFWFRNQLRTCFYTSFGNMHVYHLHQYFSARDYKLKQETMCFQNPSLCAHNNVTSTSLPCSDSELLH